MKAELTVKRPDGGRIRITAVLRVDPRGRGIIWDTEERYCPADKRKFYRAGPGFGFPTAAPEELHKARVKLWQKSKPEAF